MRYVRRNTEGQVDGHYANPQPYALEEMADDAPEIVAWDAKRKERGPTMSDRLTELERLVAEMRRRLTKCDGEDGEDREAFVDLGV